MLPKHRTRLTAGLAAVGLLLTVAVAVAGRAPKPPAEAKPNLVVHEWGTFLTVQGSDGVTLGGMVASEEVLPPFVESRGLATWQRTQIRTKMETPVTYFYTDRPLDVQVRVTMPKGILTHWYPMVSEFGPAPNARPGGAPAPSFLDWGKVSLIPHTANLAIAAGDQVPTLWRVKPDDTWRFARQTDAALVKVRSRNPHDWAEYDYEKFLFYRGLGTMDMPLEVRSAGRDDDLRLTLRNREKQPLRGLFAIWVRGETIRFAALKDLGGSAAAEVAVASALGNVQPLDEGAPKAKEAVAKALTEAGLYPKEALAMVNSWDKSYFRTEGLRLLFVLPREQVDAVIPIQIKPAPPQLVRVMVGRTEVLTPDAERQIVQWIRELGADEYPVRAAADVELARLGRLAEPALRRVVALTNDAEVRVRAERLIQAAADR